METLEEAAEFAKAAIGAAAFALEVVAATLIVAATARALGQGAKALATGEESLQSVRFDYVRALVFSLEFLVAGDLLHTIVAPTLTAVAVVGAIILVRTILAFALQQELARGGAID